MLEGYWQRPEDTKTAFVTLDSTCFLCTGDVACMDDEGHFFLVNRLKRMVNVGGLKVWPAEI